MNPSHPSIGAATLPQRRSATSRLPVRAALTVATALALASVAAPALGAQGDDRVLIDVVEDVSPSVVTLQVTTGGTADDGTTLPAGQGSGSGVIIDPSGLILTNAHVAGDATAVTVVLRDGRTFEARTVGVDTLTDFAFVRIEDSVDLPAATLGDSSALRVGQLAIAMGDPLGEFPGTITTGIVSSLDRQIVVADPFGGGQTLRHLIQTDAAINPGNSGGPLVDGDGRVIGINTAASGDATGIGFALPIDLARPIIEQVLAGEPIARPFIGIRYEDLDAQIAEDNDLAVSDGAWVHVDAAIGEPAVVAGGPARKAGLKNGDIITALDEQAIDGEHPLDLLLLQHAPGDTVTLSVLRGDRTISLEVTLGTRPASD